MVQTSDTNQDTKLNFLSHQLVPSTWEAALVISTFQTSQTPSTYRQSLIVLVSFTFDTDAEMSKMKLQTTFWVSSTWRTHTRLIWELVLRLILKLKINGIKLNDNWIFIIRKLKSIWLPISTKKSKSSLWLLLEGIITNYMSLGNENLWSV